MQLAVSGEKGGGVLFILEKETRHTWRAPRAAQLLLSESGVNGHHVVYLASDLLSDGLCTC